MRRINKKIATLQMGLSVPDTVTERAEEAFRKIQEGNTIPKTAKKKNIRYKYSNKRAWAAIFAILVMSTATVSASTFIKWSQSLEKGLFINKTQKTSLENSNAVSNPNLSVTDHGVTITAQQCIVDKYSAILTFKIKGYELPDDRIPMFAVVDIQFDGKHGFNGSHSFYSRVLANQEKGCFMYDDGTPIGRNEEVNTKDQYIMDDGSLEYRIECYGDFRGRLFHAELTGLGNLDKKDNKEFDVPGTWTFDWTLEGTDASEILTLNEPLGDTGIIVSTVEFSPISIHVTYSLPDKLLKKSFADKASESEYMYEVVWEKTPELSAVHTKSGELIFTPFQGTGSFTDSGKIDKISQTPRIMEAGEIDALWFCKDGFFAKNLYEAYDEDDFYIIPISQ